jgi:predicted DCC family thiol-disulfide oxidoreductase YuxK
MNSVFTEMTDRKDSEVLASGKAFNPAGKVEKPVILFDGDCTFCRSFVQKHAVFLAHHGFSTLPLQTPWVRELLQTSPTPLLAEMRLLASEGTVFGGANALLEIAQKIWWVRPARWVAYFPGVKPLLRKAYGWIARNRYCFGECEITPTHKHKSDRFLGLVKWAPFVGLPIAAGACGWKLPGIVLMGLMGVALFTGAKWITLFCKRDARYPITPFRLFAYFFVWPGMDARAFLGLKMAAKSSWREWAGAVSKTLFGAAIIWIAVPIIPITQPLCRGWVGMVGIVFLLHFGIFHLLSLFWRAFGFNAKPIMNVPAAATSLSKFWSGHWNRAFSDLMRDNFFPPLHRRFGKRMAVLIVFLISGLCHEAMISLPAHGGYGLPTLYFGIQGAGILFERGVAGRRPGLARGWRGWCFTFVLTAVPAFWLFHPFFVRNVILPLLHVVGAT